MTALEVLANTCTEIINNPELNVNKITDLLKNKENNKIVFLSLVKVFKQIVPLYKIRLLSDKIKHKTGNLEISQFDKDLFLQYNLFIKELCAADIQESFVGACELLKTLDHFNFADRITSKVLIGTKYDNMVGLLCVDTLVDRIKNDVMGDIVFMIINQCLDYKHSEKIIQALLECKYLKSCVEIRIDKEEKYNAKRIEEKKLERRVRKGKGFFKKTYATAKDEKKEEKKRLQLEKTVKGEETETLNILNDKNYVQTINALQRLYFTILKNGMVECFKYTFLGITEYIKLIRVEFHEGLLVLLNDAIKKSPTKAQIEGILCILRIYGENGYDFKKVLDVLFPLLHPMNFELESHDFFLIRIIIKMLFIKVRQPRNRINALLQRLLQARSIRYIPEYEELIKEIEVIYDIDFTDGDIKTKHMYDPSITDIDRVDAKPFFEYYLFKKIF